MKAGNRHQLVLHSEHPADIPIILNQNNSDDFVEPFILHILEWLGPTYYEKN